AQQHDDAQREGDVGGRGNRPAVKRLGVGVVEGGVDERRHHHAAERGHRRQHRLAARGEFTLDELALDLQPHEQEERRHPQVVDPDDQRLVQDHEPADAHLAGQREQGLVPVGRGRVADDQGQHRGNGEQHAAGRFARDETGERAGQSQCSAGFGSRTRLRHARLRMRGRYLPRSEAAEVSRKAGAGAGSAQSARDTRLPRASTLYSSSRILKLVIRMSVRGAFESDDSTTRLPSRLAIVPSHLNTPNARRKGWTRASFTFACLPASPFLGASSTVCDGSAARCDVETGLLEATRCVLRSGSERWNAESSTGLRVVCFARGNSWALSSSKLSEVTVLIWVPTLLNWRERGSSISTNAVPAGRFHPCERSSMASVSSRNAVSSPRSTSRRYLTKPPL